MQRIVPTPETDEPTRWCRALVVLAGLALVASACAGDETRAVATTPSAQAPISDPAVDASPLERAVGFSSEPQRRSQMLATTQRRANEDAVQCMRAAGFTYFVEPVSAVPLFGTQVGDGSRGWVEVNGLGIVTALVDLSNLDAAERFDAAAANASYTATLSVEQTIAYDAALIGSGPPSVNLGTAGFSPDGCWGQAYFDVFDRLRALSEFESDLDVLNTRIEDDPRVAALMQSWSDCMQAQGYRYVSRGDMVDDLFARLLSVDYSESAAGLEFRDPAAVDELLSLEIGIALDDFDCHADIADPLEVIRRDYERRFVDDNGGRISALGATPQD